MRPLNLERDHYGNYRITPTQLAECFTFILCEQEELLAIVVMPAEDAAIGVMQSAMKMHAPDLALKITPRLWREVYRGCVRFARQQGIPTFYDFYTGMLEPLPPTMLKPPTKRLIRAFRRTMAADAKRSS